MVFTTQLFTFAFLPIFLVAYYAIYFLQQKLGFLQKIRAIDWLMIAFSLGFYSWACFDDVFVFLGYIALVYVMGLVIQHTRDRRTGLALTDGEGVTSSLPIALIVTLLFCAVITAILVHFKYLGLVADFWNFLLKDAITPKTIIAPLGISFITFSAVSYLVDIYKGRADAGSPVDCLLYLSFFAKVVSGPIVLWRDFKAQRGSVRLAGVADGVSRVMIGFAKKAILADTFGLCISKAVTAIDQPTAIGMGLLYMLQIYYDFSGYSDIALGISKMLGFEFNENFNFPYVSTSITEFWRRWHISLGRWFREYIYFPLGGSRCSKARTIVNIAVVFVLTGIWHGAGWTYMLWGAINGLCNIAEKLMADKPIYTRTPAIVKWLLTMVVTFFCWELFRAPTIGDAWHSISTMFGIVRHEDIAYTWQHYFDAQIIVFAVVGILGSTVFGLPRVQAAYGKLVETKGGYILTQAITAALFVVAVLFMVNSTYSPFLYFQY